MNKICNNCGQENHSSASICSLCKEPLGATVPHNRLATNTQTQQQYAPPPVQQVQLQHMPVQGYQQQAPASRPMRPIPAAPIANTGKLRLPLIVLGSIFALVGVILLINGISNYSEYSNYMKLVKETAKQMADIFGADYRNLLGEAKKAMANSPYASFYGSKLFLYIYAPIIGGSVLSISGIVLLLVASAKIKVRALSRWI